jgi:hypothetical protein
MSEQEATPPEGSIQLPVVWVGVDELPVHHVNQLVGTVSPQEVFLTLGTLVPPAIMADTPEERRAQAQGIGFVQIRPVVRVGITEQALRDFIGILEQTLKNFETLKRISEEPGE